MISKTVNINLPSDAEARPVAMLVQIASQFESKIYLIEKNKKINAKSIMGMMSMDFSQGEEITVEADGADAEQAVEEITKYIETRA